MKKFLIYLSTFLFLFGVSTAFAGVYIEDFEDGIDPPLQTTDAYEIVNGKFHMLTGTVQGDYVVGDVWARLPNEFVYHFEGETQMVTDQFNLHPTISYKNPEMSIELSFYGEVMEIWVNLYQTDVGWVSEYLEELTSGMLYYWSITAHQDHVTIEINNNKYELFHAVFQRPPAVSVSWTQVRGITGAGLGHVEYFADNLVVYTSTGETIDDVLDSVGEWIENEELVGVGNGNSAAGRLNAFVNMLQNARDLFNAGDIAGACAQLEDAYRKCDGESPPPDFVEGDEAQNLRDMITTLMADFGC